ncbi:MAG: hypothetical protein COT74_03220 [Bdellovibrionales bacterium CG10_big_fil_rev_8_21_14_0_10_45_34]|nr:MAG: hypothetical protein COT74_03220 [Bdellovibrionales bacterium CG10_big_fil_rev_8_21_14_0_10_45_34]
MNSPKRQSFRYRTFQKDRFTENLGQTTDLIVDTISSFLSTYSDQLAKIETAITTGNLQDLEISAHALKGAVSNFYADEAYLIAWKLEQMGHDKVTTDTLSLFQQLTVAINHLTLDLRDFLDEITNK